MHSEIAVGSLKLAAQAHTYAPESPRIPTHYTVSDTISSENNGNSRHNDPSSVPLPVYLHLNCTSKMSPNWPYLRNVEGSIEAGWFLLHGRAATFWLIENSWKSSEITSESQNCVLRLNSINYCATDFRGPIESGFNMVLKEDFSKSAHFEQAVIFFNIFLNLMLKKVADDGST